MTKIRVWTWVYIIIAIFATGQAGRVLWVVAGEPFLAIWIVCQTISACVGLISIDLREARS